MDTYSSEKEQIEALRKWWQNNGKAIMVGVVVGTGALVGWQSWQLKTRTAAEATSSQYEHLIAQVNQNQPGAAADIGRNIAASSRQDGYKSLSSLFLARLEAESDNPDAALAHLHHLLNQPPNSQMEKLARLRSARLLLDKGRSEEALAMLDVVDPGSFSSSYSALRGDILLAGGDIDGARMAWLEVLSEIDARSPLRAVVQTKIDDLGVPERDNE